MDFDRFGSGVTVIELAPGLIAREDADLGSGDRYFEKQAN